MKNITRRAFLKTAGATALAVGAVGMLSGCGLGDFVAGSIPTLGDKIGCAAENSNGVVYTLNNDCQWWKVDGKLALFRLTFSVKNMTDHEVVFNASDIKSATLNGYPTRIVLDPEHDAKISVKGAGELLFDKTTGSRTYRPSNNMSEVAVGASIYFEPIYPEGDAGITGDWSSFEMKFTFAGKETTFVMNRDAGGKVTSSRK